MKKLILLITILIISSYLFIEFVGDNLIKNVLQNNISTSLNRNVSIEKLNINYFNGEADVKEIQLSNKEFWRISIPVAVVIILLIVVPWLVLRSRKVKLRM